ncbi:MAG: hypothetical protein KC635_00275, partial [Myxococcales bacterium]|nr:hypothetical protein [Myxococcales bacterium]
GKRWRLADAPPDATGRKRHGVEGPLRDVWNGPFVVVWGASDPGEADANRLTAEAVRRYNPWTELAMPMLADTEVTPEDLRGRGVVLVGGPRGNRVVREIADRLPVTFEPGALVFGGKRYAGDGVGISTVFPSPFDPEQVIVLHAGVGPEGTLSARYLPEWAPDWLIYDDGMRATWWDYFLGKRQVLAAGFYDERWGLP